MRRRRGEHDVRGAAAHAVHRRVEVGGVGERRGRLQEHEDLGYLVVDLLEDVQHVQQRRLARSRVPGEVRRSVQHPAPAARASSAMSGPSVETTTVSIEGVASAASDRPRHEAPPAHLTEVLAGDALRAGARGHDGEDAADGAHAPDATEGRCRGGEHEGATSGSAQEAAAAPVVVDGCRRRGWSPPAVGARVVRCSLPTTPSTPGRAGSSSPGCPVSGRRPPPVGSRTCSACRTPRSTRCSTGRTGNHGRPSSTTSIASRASRPG